MRLRLIGMLVFAATLAACSKGTETSASPSSSASAEAAATATAASLGTAASSVATGATDTPAPTPTPNPNLLAEVNGTIVRSYTASLAGNPDDYAEHGFPTPSTPGPITIVWELPGVADITGLTIDVSGIDQAKRPASITIAGSTSGVDSGFSDIASAKSQASETTPSPSVRTKARWVRATIDPGDTQYPMNSLVLVGTIEPRPANAPMPSLFVVHDSPYKDGKYIGTDTSGDPWYATGAHVGNSYTTVKCSEDAEWSTSMMGTLNGRTWTVADLHSNGQMVLNDEGTMLIGNPGSKQHYDVVAPSSKACYPRVVGSGPRHILMLDSNGPANQYGLNQGESTPYTFTRINASMVTSELLAKNDAVILNMVCNTDDFLSQGQGDALNAYVQAGHPLIMWDSDACGPTTHYGFLPYQFKTNNPGAAGARGKNLINVESNALGSLDPTDKARFVDVKAYTADDNNQLGDANTTVTKDDHWCGHLFGTNSQNVNGFMQMYMPSGQGVYIFDGLDHDDADRLPHQKIRTLEMQLAMPADLPCKVKANASFVLQPNQEADFVSGVAKTMPFHMSVLANQGWKGHIAMSVDGPFKAALDAMSFDMSGDTHDVGINVSIPKDGKPGQLYVDTVTASDGAGTQSQATISFNGTAPPKVIFKQKRIRLYGIHFDYDSARLQPRSEPVIKEIADIMNQDKSIRFIVEGHTDSDGGAPYNLKLSQRRAESVIADLLHRYHITASRLRPKGYGLTRPVASNATEAGKALNRRVELVRF